MQAHEMIDDNGNGHVLINLPESHLNFDNFENLQAVFESNFTGTFTINMSKVKTFEPNILAMFLVFRDIIGGESGRIAITNCPKSFKDQLEADAMLPLFDVTTR